MEHAPESKNEVISEETAASEPREESIVSSPEEMEINIPPEITKEEIEYYRRNGLDNGELDVVLKGYDDYLKNPDNKELRVKILNGLWDLIGMGRGEYFLTTFTKRIATKSGLALLLDDINNRGSWTPGSSREFTMTRYQGSSNGSFTEAFEHTIDKCVDIEMKGQILNNQFFEDLALLVIRECEAISGKTSIGHARRNLEYYKKLDEIKYRPEIKEYELLIEALKKERETLANENDYYSNLYAGRNERAQKYEPILFAEIEAFINKYKDQISLEAIMQDVKKIKEVLGSLLEQ